MLQPFSFFNNPQSACRRTNVSVLLLAAVLLVQQMPVLAQGFDKAKYLQKRLAKAAQAKTWRAGNAFYTIFIESVPGEGVGLYSVATGPEHPVTREFGGPQDLLAGASQELTGTSYTTIRSYNSGTDYVQSEFAKSTDRFRTVWLDSLRINDSGAVDPVILPIFTNDQVTGYQVVDSLPGLPRDDQRFAIRDELVITHIVNAHGRNFDNAWVEITTIVKNTGQETAHLGIRYLWDLNIAGDDGPVLTQRGGDAFGPNETVMSPANYAFYEAAANDRIDAPPPAYSFFGSALTPANLLRTEQQPTLMQQVFWPLAFFKAFNYTLTDTLRVIGGRDDPLSRLTGGDNAVTYFWGDRRDNAIALDPGKSVQVTQGLFGGSPNSVLEWDPPVCDIVAINPGPPKSIDVTVQDEASGLASIRVLQSDNAQVDIADFELGTNELVHVNGTAVDPEQPLSFTIIARDLSGNQCICDPILFAWQPELQNHEYHFAPIFADRYFYLNNDGVERITADLNGARFVLSANGPFDAQTFKMPLQGEMAIDISRHLRAEQNRMTLTFSGPPNSRIDILLADMNPKGDVDLVLDLAGVPRQFALAQNLPNPFRGRTAIRFELPETEQPAQFVDLRIYNTLGQVVRRLVHRKLKSNTHVAEWDGRDEYGREAAAGVYFYRLTAGGLQLTKKMTLVR